MGLLPMPFNNPRTYPNHSGVDFPQPRGTPIRASGPGVVLRTSYTLAGGYWTVIRYDNGATFGYAHQDRPVTVVKASQRVVESQVIGYVGSLGLRSTGPHLHLTDIDNQTYAATMARLDTSRVVGQGTPAGSGGTPVDRPTLPDIPTPAREEPDMATGIIYTDDAADKNRSGAIINTDSGFVSKFGWFTKSYADNLAKGFGLPAAGQVTRGQYDQILKDMGELRARQS